MIGDLGVLSEEGLLGRHALSNFVSRAHLESVANLVVEASPCVCARADDGAASARCHIFFRPELIEAVIVSEVVGPAVLVLINHSLVVRRVELRCGLAGYIIRDIFTEAFGSSECGDSGDILHLFL